MPLAALIVGGIGFYASGEIRRDVESLREADLRAVELGAAALDDALERVTRDLAFVAAHPELHRLLDAPTAATRARLARDFTNFVGSMGRYAQLRWIDGEGRERVRVEMHDGVAREVPDERLQDKSDRYYFRAALGLEPGTVFVSPLDLNVENGEIERPFKPMIRVATAVSDAAGAKRGIVVLNYFGNDLLQHFARASMGIGDRAMLLNAEGFWLKSPIAEDQWGFMLGRAEATLARRDAAAWAMIAGGDRGQAVLAGALWTWRTVRPLDAGMVSSSASAPPGAPSRRALDAEDYVWKVVAQLPASALARPREVVLARLLLPALALLALAALGSWRLALAWRRQADAEAALREANRDLRKRVDERTQALNQKVHALIESDARFRTTFETAAVGMARVSPMGRFIEINQAFCDLIGYSREEILSNAFSFQQITYPEDLDADLQHVDRLLRGEGDHYEMEKRYIRKDGSCVWANLSVALVRDAKGAPRYFVSSVSDLSERKRLEAELLATANSDFLTGLANRRHFMEKLADELARVKRGDGARSGLLMLDLDFFKRVNDRHGHAVGDELLRHFAVLASHELRRIDTVGRIGGEEFAIILPGADADATMVFAERLRRRVMDAPMSVGDQQIDLTVSIGVAVISALDGNHEDALIRADKALYRAKANGRNRVECAHERERAAPASS